MLKYFLHGISRYFIQQNIYFGYVKINSTEVATSYQIDAKWLFKYELNYSITLT
jgi:hypothetical protein